MFNLLLSVAIIASSSIQWVVALPTISVKGSKFFANGQQFFLKGVAYQGTPSDPLVDTKQCQLDAQSMATLGTNSIRVYHVNPYVSHDGCMSAFEAVGIYVWLDLDTFNTTIEQTSPTWTESQFQAFAFVMDVFQKYDNLAGFWIGNEVINTATGSPAAPYVKAAVADMKSYMKHKNYRTIPIGYSAADIAELRPALQNYLACGSDPDQSIDFYGLNSYEWCGNNYYEASGYETLQAMSVGYSIPIFFSETGCNVGGPRLFQDQSGIFGPKMVDTWSGSIIYEWVQETNNYGLVSYPNGQIYNGAPIPMQPDFQNLMGQWKSINPSGIAESAYSPSFAPPACPAASGGWLVNGNPPIPTLGGAVVQAVAAKPSPSPPPPSPSTTPPSTISPPPSTTPPPPSATPLPPPGATPVPTPPSATPLSPPGATPVPPPPSATPLPPPPSATPLPPPAPVVQAITTSTVLNGTLTTTDTGSSESSAMASSTLTAAEEKATSGTAAAATTSKSSGDRLVVPVMGGALIWLLSALVG